MIISWHFINKVSIFVIILQTSQKVVIMLLGISQLGQSISIYEITFWIVMHSCSKVDFKRTFCYPRILPKNGKNNLIICSTVRQKRQNHKIIRSFLEESWAWKNHYDFVWPLDYSRLDLKNQKLMNVRLCLFWSTEYHSRAPSKSKDFFQNKLKFSWNKKVSCSARRCTATGSMYTFT